MSFRINEAKFSLIFSVALLTLLIVINSNCYSADSDGEDYEVVVVKIAPNNSNTSRTSVYFTAKDGTFTDKSYSSNDHELAVVLFALANNLKLYVNMNLSGVISSVNILME